jgi:hypothetical protein
MGIRSTLQLWLVFMAFAGAGALLIAAHQRAEGIPWPGQAAQTTQTTQPPRTASTVHTTQPEASPRTVLAPTFAEAAESLRSGRHAEAYGRFVELADEGDADAGRIALLMHRFGPSVFGSSWDASVEQLVLWTRWSQLEAENDLSKLRSLSRRPTPDGS